MEEKPSPSGPHESFEAREAHRRVWNALEALSDAHREALVLCDLEERTNAEAATLLGLPVGTVKSRLRAARVAFRAELEQSDAARLVQEGGR